MTRKSFWILMLMLATAQGQLIFNSSPQPYMQVDKDQLQLVGKDASGKDGQLLMRIHNPHGRRLAGEDIETLVPCSVITANLIQVVLNAGDVHHRNIPLEEWFTILEKEAKR